MAIKFVGFVWGEDAPAQERQVEALAKLVGAELLDTYNQQETGRHSKWEQLRDAIDVAEFNNALLVVATVEGKRLGLKRNVPVLTLLDEIEGFVLADVLLSAVAKVDPKKLGPELTAQTVAAIFQANKEHCRKEISKLLKNAKKWSADESKRRKAEMAERMKSGWKPPAGNADPKAGNVANQQAAQKHAEELAEIVLGLHKQGLSQRDIAQKLNELGHRTRTGKEFSNVQVMRILKRLEGKEQ